MKNQESLEAHLLAVEGTQPPALSTNQSPGTISDAKVSKNLIKPKPARPCIVPPSQSTLKSLKPRKTILHLDPKHLQLQRTESGFLFKNANEVLQKLATKSNCKMIAIHAPQVLKLDNFCFFSKDKSLLRDNKHIWTKEVHLHLAATPSTYSLIAHRVPKNFNPIAPTSINKISAEKNIWKGILIQIKWLVENFGSNKQLD